MRVNSGTPRNSSRALAMALSMALTLSPVAGIAGPAGPEAAVPSAGGLSIETNPVGAAVYVDGQYAGLTPLTVSKVTSGDHRVRVVKDGFLDNARVVSVAAGQPKALSIQMTRDAHRPVANQISGGGSSGGSGKSALTNPYVLGAIGGGGALGAYLLLRDTNKAPTAGTISASPSGTGQAGITSYTFSTTASDEDDDPLTYSWDFGDGTTGTGASPTKTYATNGTFNVVVTVSDGKKEADSAAFSVTVARNLTGTFTGGVEAGFTGSFYSVEWTQSGTSISGRMNFSGAFTGGLNITGTVSARTYPATVTFTSQSYTVQTGVTAIDSFTGTTDSTGTTITGTTTVTLTGATWVSTGTAVATAATTLRR